MNGLSGYVRTIVVACLAFFPVAGLFTLPFMVHQYRRYGRIPFLRVLVVYAFILYMMCAFFLTMLPLPKREAVAAMTGKYTQLVPFSTYKEAFNKAGLFLFSPKTLFSFTNWKRFIGSSGLFEILANVVMQIPLGVFLRYYFKRNRRQTLLIGMCVSLLYELVQLSGLFFIYVRPYRLASVDDVFDNTLGALIGYAIAPLLCRFLPTRDELDRMSVEREGHATPLRRLTSAVVDWLVWLTLTVLAAVISGQAGRVMLGIGLVWAFLVNVLVQRLTGGYTIGKKLLRLRVIDSDTRACPKIGRLLTRYAMIYLLLPLVLFFFGCAVIMPLLLAILLEDMALRLLSLLVSFAFCVLAALWIMKLIKRRRGFPHSYLTHTEVISERA